MSASSQSVVCKSAENLKASVTGLKDVNISANGTSAVSDQFTKIKQDFNTLKADAKGQYWPRPAPCPAPWASWAQASTRPRPA